MCANPYLIHANFNEPFHFLTTASRINTDPLSSCFISFIFFKLHIRTLFPFAQFISLFSVLFYSNPSCRESVSWDKAVFCCDITRTFTNTILPRRFARTPTADWFQNTKLPPPLQTEHKIYHLLHCSLSLLFKYLLTQLSQQH